MWVYPRAAFALHNFMGNLLGLDSDMLLQATLTSLPCLLCFISSLTYSLKICILRVSYILLVWL